MWIRSADWGGMPSFTRISVTGTRDCYIVREGGAPAVRVRVSAGRLHCECGRPRCRHIASLMACGFVEESAENAEAA